MALVAPLNHYCSSFVLTFDWPFSTGQHFQCILLIIMTISLHPSPQFSSKVLDLARKQRMNTDIRRNIFCVIMTSEDYLDAFEKLIRCVLFPHPFAALKCLHTKLAIATRFNTWHCILFCVQDGAEGPAGEGDRPRADGLLPPGEELQCLLCCTGREVL